MVRRKVGQHQLAVPTLEDVRSLQRPAWLWDGRRGRIAWANDSGIAFFGGETVFDVIDRVFDLAEPGIETIAFIGRNMRRGESLEASLLFPSAGKSKPIACACYVHALPDGRPGILAVANETEVAKGVAGEELVTAFEFLPSATILTSRYGEIRFANASAKELLGEDDRSGLESELRGLASRLDKVATVSLIRRIETAVGERDLRITARRLKGEGDNASYAVVTLEDITDRRELERQLTSKSPTRPITKLEAVKAKLTDNEAAAFDALGAALKQAAQVSQLALRAAEPAPRPQPTPESLSGVGAPPPAPSVEVSTERTVEVLPLPASPRPYDGETPVEPVIPLFIRKTLDSFPGANLFVRNGKIVYANPAAIELLKHPGLITLLSSAPLADAVAKLDRDTVELPCADGAPLRVSVQTTQVPWINGPANRLNLTAAPLEPEPAIEEPPQAQEARAMSSIEEEPQSAPSEPQQLEIDAGESTASTEELEAKETPAPQEEIEIEDVHNVTPAVAAQEPARHTSLPPPPRLDSIFIPAESYKAAAPPPETPPPLAEEVPAEPEPENFEPAAPETVAEEPGLPEATPASPPAPRPASTANMYAAEEELRAILDTAADGIVTLDSDGDIRTLSAGAEAIFGYRVAEVEGKPLANLLAPDSRKVLREYLSALQGPGLASVFNDGREVTAVVKQGGEIPLFLTVSKMHSARPGGAAFGAVVRDITQWKKTEAELREARDRAEQASRQKSEFLANISHELRTPLNAILGFSEMMRMGSFGDIRNEKYKGYVNDIHASGAHLLSLINDLLDLSKVEAGKLELNFTSVNLSDVADHCFKLVHELASANRVILRKNIAGDLPNVVADQRSMRQIMLNLLSNAIKFTDPGGQVIVSAEMLKSGELKLRVRDTGIGMNEEQLRHALEPFRRVTTDDRDAEGTGLGLPLTKALAEANRTAFSISSEPRKGTLVEITFPTTRVLAE
jgi:PAS domain S-box-containing protein